MGSTTRARRVLLPPFSFQFSFSQHAMPQALSRGQQQGSFTSFPAWQSPSLGREGNTPVKASLSLTISPFRGRQVLIKASAPSGAASEKF